MNLIARSLVGMLGLIAMSLVPCDGFLFAQDAIKHSYLVLGAKTAIIGEDGTAQAHRQPQGAAGKKGN